MNKTIITTSQFKRDVKHLKKQNNNFNILKDIIIKLGNGVQIPSNYKSHKLHGKWQGYFECHIQPNWLLIWKETKSNIYLTRTGSHSELFK